MRVYVRACVCMGGLSKQIEASFISFSGMEYMEPGDCFREGVWMAARHYYKKNAFSLPLPHTLEIPTNTKKCNVM